MPEAYKIGRDQFCPLVDELEKGVLRVGTRFAPDNRPGLIGHPVPVAVDAFPVAFHHPLLQVGGQAVQVLGIRDNRLGFCPMEIVVPEAEQAQYRRQVFAQGRGAEMPVHVPGPPEEV